MTPVPKATWRYALDRAEQVLLVIAYFWFLRRIWPDDFDPGNWFPLLLLFSEGLVVLFVLLRRSTDTISIRPYDWFIGMAGTILALGVTTGGDPLVPPIIGFIPLMSGVLIHTASKLSLRRSFGVVAASRGVMLNGMYRFVRHPMYAGYMLSHFGYLLMAPSYWNLSVYLSVWTLLVLRIFAEERILNEDPEYRAYAEEIKDRLIPFVF